MHRARWVLYSIHKHTRFKLQPKTQENQPILTSAQNWYATAVIASENNLNPEPQTPILPQEAEPKKNVAPLRMKKPLLEILEQYVRFPPHGAASFPDHVDFLQCIQFLYLLDSISITVLRRVVIEHLKQQISQRFIFQQELSKRNHKKDLNEALIKNTSLESQNPTDFIKKASIATLSQFFPPLRPSSIAFSVPLLIPLFQYQMLHGSKTIESNLGLSLENKIQHAFERYITYFVEWRHITCMNIVDISQTLRSIVHNWDKFHEKKKYHRYADDGEGKSDPIASKSSNSVEPFSYAQFEQKIFPWKSLYRILLFHPRTKTLRFFLSHAGRLLRNPNTMIGRAASLSYPLARLLVIWKTFLDFFREKLQSETEMDHTTKGKADLSTLPVWFCLSETTYNECINAFHALQAPLDPALNGLKNETTKLFPLKNSPLSTLPLKNQIDLLLSFVVLRLPVEGGVLERRFDQAIQDYKMFLTRVVQRGSKISLLSLSCSLHGIIVCTKLLPRREHITELFFPLVASHANKLTLTIVGKIFNLTGIDYLENYFIPIMEMFANALQDQSTPLPKTNQAITAIALSAVLAKKNCLPAVASALCFCRAVSHGPLTPTTHKTLLYFSRHTFTLPLEVCVAALSCYSLGIPQARHPSLSQSKQGNATDQQKKIREKIQARSSKGEIFCILRWLCKQLGLDPIGIQKNDNHVLSVNHVLNFCGKLYKRYHFVTPIKTLDILLRRTLELYQRTGRIQHELINTVLRCVFFCLCTGHKRQLAFYEKWLDQASNYGINYRKGMQEPIARLLLKICRIRTKGKRKPAQSQNSATVVRAERKEASEFSGQGKTTQTRQPEKLKDVIFFAKMLLQKKEKLL